MEAPKGDRLSTLIEMNEHMKYTAIGMILATALIGGLAKFELSARENLILVQEHRGTCRDKRSDDCRVSMNGGTESSDEYLPPNNGGPDSQNGTGSR